MSFLLYLFLHAGTGTDSKHYNQEQRAQGTMRV
jgi:hypothetical protein